MRVAFYAPMKPPDHPVPSGDRRMARSLIEALRCAGHEVELASRFRSYDGRGDRPRQTRLASLGARVADRLAGRLEGRSPAARPEAWLSYHVYHKSPDHLGPRISRRLGIPYLIAEASIARKRATGRFAPGFAASVQAIEAADLVFAMTAVDRAGLEGVVRPPARIVDLPPFTDPAPFLAARRERTAHREQLAVRYGLDPSLPWLIAVGMMRADAKLCSYRQLARALGRVGRPYALLVVGDGPARAEVEQCLAGLGQRVAFTGRLALELLPGILAAADLFVWPAVREAYGLAMLEAAAAGLAVVAGRSGGVEEVVRHGASGLLVPPGEPAPFADAVRSLLDQPGLRHRMGDAAARFVATERSLAQATRILDQAIEAALAIHRRRSGGPGLRG